MKLSCAFSCRADTPQRISEQGVAREHKGREWGEAERERQVVIKTTAARMPELEARVHELHPYEVPEFVALPIEGGSERYLSWIRESTAKTG